MAMNQSEWENFAFNSSNFIFKKWTVVGLQTSLAIKPRKNINPSVVERRPTFPLSDNTLMLLQ